VKPNRRFPGALAALALAFSAACQAVSRPLTAAHRAAIVDSVQTMLTAWRDAFNGNDFARAAAFYSNDPAFRWFENGELKFRSGSEIGDSMKAEAPGFRSLALSLIEPQITPLAPGVAVVTTNFAQKITDTTGQVIGLAGAITTTVVHGDGGWKFLVGHVSLVTPSSDTARKAKGRRA
jgi:ketosteroid isomerase-like protein